MLRSRDARWFTKGVLAVALVGLAVCSEQPMGVLSPPTFDFASGGRGGNPGNPWTGRSGSAAITAYALFSAGAANLTVTSYRAADSLFATPVGCIDKIQVKVYDGRGRLVSTQNFNNLRAGSSVTVSVRGAQVGYRLALHVNVSCIDPRRTDVVDADVDVIQPNITDPAVIRLKVPGTPLTSAPVTISAFVKVTRGLAAATGNCALYVNADQVAVLPAVTIAGGDSIPCTFTRTFSTPGTVQITAAFENVSPTDLNPTNNSASTYMPVYVTPPEFSITANLYDDTMTYHDLLTQSSRRIPDVSKLYDTLPADQQDVLYPLVDTLLQSTDSIGNAQHAQFVGVINTQVQFPLTILTVSQTSGAITYHSRTWTNLARSSSSGADADCQDVLTGAVSLQLCAYGPSAQFPNGWTKIVYLRDTASVAASEVQYKVDYRDPSEAPLADCDPTSTNLDDNCYTITTLLGPALVHYGTSYTFNVVIQDRTHRFSATVTTDIERGTLQVLESDPASYRAVTDNSTGNLLRFRYLEGLVNDRIRYSGPIADLIGLTETIAP